MIYIHRRMLQQKLATYAFSFCLFLLFASISIWMLQPINVHAVTFDDINQTSVFLKQEKGSGTCTLVSATMMVRRAAMMDGNSDWAAITESAMRGSAWYTGIGLRHSFQYAGITVSHAEFDGKEDTLKGLLEKHPEGVVVYGTMSNGGVHAILVTDYTDETFYCADPSQGCESGRIPISKASITIASAKAVWYVSSPKVSYSVDATGVLGDVDGNGQVDLSDAQLVLQAALGITTFDEVQKKAADADENGMIDLEDAQQILKTALGIVSV